jgi:hypothetical protein
MSSFHRGPHGMGVTMADLTSLDLGWQCFFVVVHI